MAGAGGSLGWLEECLWDSREGDREAPSQTRRGGGEGREAGERKGLREEQDKKQKLGGSETERGGHRGRQTEKLGARVGPDLTQGALERGAELGAAPEGIFQKGVRSQAVG